MRPRHGIANISLRASDTLEMKIHAEEGLLEIGVTRDDNPSSPLEIDYKTFYVRPKKPKYISGISFKEGRGATFNQTDALKDFAGVWALDTNKNTISGKSTNVSVATVCATDGTETIYPVLAMLFGSTVGNPERLAWRTFIEFVIATERYDPEGRYGLIVDSELNRLGPMNRQKMPVHGTYFLPENWTLLYATSDVANDTVLNKAISLCDKVSKRILADRSTVLRFGEFIAPVQDEESPTIALVPIRARAAE